MTQSSSESESAAMERLNKIADCLIVDCTPVDAYGRFELTYGDLRALRNLVHSSRHAQTPEVLRNAVIEECARHIENEADVATNSLHCGDNSQTIAAVHRVSRVYHEAAKSIRALSDTSTDHGGNNG